MFLDAHCHLERETYGDELEAVIARAFDAGLTHLVVVGASGVSQGAHEAVRLAEQLPQAYASVGIHPHDAAKAGDADIAVLEGYLRHPKVVALGEIGLDYYYDNSPRREQRELFTRLARLGRERNVPIMLHVRDAHPAAEGGAHEDTWEVLDDVGLPERGGVVHCFTGGPTEAEEYLERGMYLSIPGIVTFKTAEALREAVRLAPLDRLFIETDCPYLAPVPHRGKRNEPAYIVETAKKIAEIKGLSLDRVGRATRANALAFYGIEGADPGHS